MFQNSDKNTLKGASTRCIASEVSRTNGDTDFTISYGTVYNCVKRNGNKAYKLTKTIKMNNTHRKKDSILHKKF